MEKERERHGGGPSNDSVGVHVTLHGNYVGKIQIPRGGKLSDLVEAIRAKDYAVELNQCTVMLNDRKIEVTADGKLEEDPALTEDSALSLVKKFTGGDVVGTSKVPGRD